MSVSETVSEHSELLTCVLWSKQSIAYSHVIRQRVLTHQIWQNGGAQIAEYCVTTLYGLIHIWSRLSLYIASRPHSLKPAAHNTCLLHDVDRCLSNSTALLPLTRNILSTACLCFFLRRAPVTQCRRSLRPASHEVLYAHYRRPVLLLLLHRPPLFIHRHHFDHRLVWPTEFSPTSEWRGLEMQYVLSHGVLYSYYIGVHGAEHSRLTDDW